MRNRADERMRRALEAAKFDFARPDPRIARQAFKVFAAEDVPGLTSTTVGYSAYHASDRDSVLWLFFARTFEQADGVGWHAGCLLSSRCRVLSTAWTMSTGGGQGNRR